MRFPIHLPADPAKRKQLLLAVAAAAAVLAAYVYSRRGAGAGSSVPADQIAPDPSAAVGTGDLLPATSGLPSSDAVTISSVQAAIAQAKALLLAVGLTVGPKKTKHKPPKHHPKHHRPPPPRSGMGHRKKLHPARRIGPWPKQPVRPPAKQQYPNPGPIVIRRRAPGSAVAKSSTPAPPSPYRVASRLHTGAL